MVDKKKKEKNDEAKEEEVKEEKTETPEVAEDQRVPSDPDKFKPADVPPEPLTKRDYSEIE
jgi:hypothetical protein